MRDYDLQINGANHLVAKKEVDPALIDREKKTDRETETK
jgi:hypothetical protein